MTTSFLMTPLCLLIGCFSRRSRRVIGAKMPLLEAL